MKNINILSSYRNASVNMDTALYILIKFLYQERKLQYFLDEIKEIKPYKFGNDDIKFVLKYAINLACNVFYQDISALFSFPNKFQSAATNVDWNEVDRKWKTIVGENFRLKSFYWR